MKSADYLPEIYWDRVARELEKRENGKLIAGDNDPFYAYKRKKFLTLFSAIPFGGEKVLEIGSGPGGNLLEIYKQAPACLTGTDISERMLKICKNNIGNHNIELVKINGTDIPFPEEHFDIAVTSTVLQHVTNETILTELIKRICLVTKSDVYIFERIEKKRVEEFSNTGRTIDEYKYRFGQYNMSLAEVRFLNIYWSKVYCGAVRRMFNSSKRSEGEPQSKISVLLQKAGLVITKPLDHLFPVKNDLAMLHFKKFN